jgi:hypothetical protein
MKMGEKIPDELLGRVTPGLFLFFFFNLNLFF